MLGGLCGKRTSTLAAIHCTVDRQLFIAAVIDQVDFCLPHLHSTPPLTDYCRTIAIKFCTEKVEWWKKIEDTFIRFESIHERVRQNTRTWQTPRRTERRTDTARRHRPRLSVAIIFFRSRQLDLGKFLFSVLNWCIQIAFKAPRQPTVLVVEGLEALTYVMHALKLTEHQRSKILPHGTLKRRDDERERKKPSKQSL